MLAESQFFGERSFNMESIVIQVRHNWDKNRKVEPIAKLSPDIVIEA